MRGKQDLGRVVRVAALLAAFVALGALGAACAGSRAGAPRSGAPGAGAASAAAAGEAPIAAFAIEKPSCTGIDDCEPTCRRGYGEACLVAGRFGARDRTDGTGHRYYANACAAGSSEGCLRDQLSGTTLTLREHERGCAAGIAEACERLGWAYQHGEGVPLDAKKGEAYYALAAKRYVAACEAASGFDCTGAAGLYDDGAGVARDTARADELYGRACQLGDRLGCERSGGSAHSRAAADAACKPGASEACNRVGLRYEVGREIDFDPVRAAASYQKACREKDEHGCALLGYSYEAGIGVARDEKEARRLYEEACSSGQQQACYDVARFYRAGLGGLKQNSNVAAELFTATCDNTRDGLGCRELTEMYESGEAQNTSGASVVDLYDRSCTQGDAIACEHGGALLAEGKALTRDGARAVGFYDRGCRQGSGRACYAAGKLFADGDLVPKDPDAAFVWFQRGCDASDSESCAAMAPAVFTPRPVGARRRAAAPAK
jgi:TPR repeat protein